MGAIETRVCQLFLGSVEGPADSVLPSSCGAETEPAARMFHPSKHHSTGHHDPCKQAQDPQRTRDLRASGPSCLPVGVMVSVALSSVDVEKRVDAPSLPPSLPHMPAETGSAAPRDRQPLLPRGSEGGWEAGLFFSSRLGAWVRPGVRVNVCLSPCVLLLLIGNFTVQMKKVECNESPCAHAYRCQTDLFSSMTPLQSPLQDYFETNLKYHFILKYFSA